MTEVNGRTFTITVIDANRFSIGIDTSGYAAWTGTDCDVRSVAPSPAPTPPPVPTPTPTPTPPPVIPPDRVPPGGGPLP